MLARGLHFNTFIVLLEIHNFKTKVVLVNHNLGLRMTVHHLKTKDFLLFYIELLKPKLIVLRLTVLECRVTTNSYQR